MRKCVSFAVRRERLLLRRESPLKRPKPVIKQKQAPGGSRKRFGAMYANRKWKALRKAVLAAEPFCRICQKAATDVDHIVEHRGDWELFLDRKNLQALCKECHAEKTKREQAAPRISMVLKPLLPRKG